MSATARFDQILPRATVGERLLEREQQLADTQARLTEATDNLAQAQAANERLGTDNRRLHSELVSGAEELHSAQQLARTAKRRNDELMRIAFPDTQPPRRRTGQMSMLDGDGRPIIEGHIQVFYRSKRGSTEQTMFLEPTLHDLLMAVAAAEGYEQKQAANQFTDAARRAGFGKNRCEALLRSARSGGLAGGQDSLFA